MRIAAPALMPVRPALHGYGRLACQFFRQKIDRIASGKSRFEWIKVQASGENLPNNARIAAAERAQGRNASAAGSVDGSERTSGALGIHVEWHTAEMA